MVADGPDSGPPLVPDARAALPLCLLLLGAAAPADAGEGGPPGIEVRSGRVASVDWGDRRLTLLGPAGRLDLGFDRNTVVYLPGRLGTMLDVAPGVQVRAAANPDGVAAWVEVRPQAVDGGAAGPDGGPRAGSGAGPPAGPDRGSTPGTEGGPERPDGGASR